MEANVDWLWTLGVPSAGWALYALLRHFVNLGFLLYVFRQELRQSGGTVTSAVRAMKDAAEALRLTRGDVPTYRRDRIGGTGNSRRPDRPTGDPPGDEEASAL
jgi:hypothetical protein